MRLLKATIGVATLLWAIGLAFGARADNCQFLAAPFTLSNNAIIPVQCDGHGNLIVAQSVPASPYNNGVTSTGAGLSILAAGKTGQSFYLTHITATGSGATASGLTLLSFNGPINSAGGAATLSYELYVPVLGAGGVNFDLAFNPPIQMVSGFGPQFSLNTPGAGATALALSVSGYYN